MSARAENNIMWRVAGVDSNIISSATKKWQGKYRRSAIGMLVIALMCMVSGAYTFWIIFGNVFMMIPFSAFWALIIMNLYRLVLITVGNPHIPHSPAYRFPFGSFMFRTFFLFVLGIFIIKPIEMLILQPAIAPHLEAHKNAVITAHNEQVQKFESAHIKAVFQSGNIVALVTEGGYLMARMRIMHAEFPWVWGLTALFSWIFIWPFWSRVNWRNRSEYETRRGEIEKAVVVAEYERFKEHYTRRMLELTGRDDIWEENFHDMPFCNEPIVLEEQDYMRPGSLFAWARIHAKERSAEE